MPWSDVPYSAVNSSRAARTRDLTSASSIGPFLRSAIDGILHQLDDLVERDRRFRGVNDRFEFGF